MRLERLLGLLMLAGTIASLALMALGTSLYFLQHGEEVSVSERWIVRSKSFLEFVASIGEGLSLSVVLMKAGVATLMLTPYSRAVISLVYFAARREWKFTAITGLVVTALSALLMLPAAPS